jgi:hypothetical protein
MGCETLRILHLHDNWLTDGGKIVNLGIGRALVPRNTPYCF